MNIKDRIQRLRQKLIEKEVDAILVSQPENRYYLSGFDGSAGFLLITAQKQVLATDFRYIEQAKMQAPDYEIFRTIGNLSEWFPGFVAEQNINRLGFESGHLTFSTYAQLSDILKSLSRPKLVPLNGIVESLRIVKEPEEIALITRAVKLTDRAFKYGENILRPGITEKALAWEIERFIREHGSQSVPFELIVVAGAVAALPHAKPSDRPIKAGETVIVDIGAKISGYTSDMTRTFWLGTRDDTFERVYQTVLNAKLTAIAGIKAGMTGHEVDNIAREVIKKAAYGEAFGHGLGHGIGLATHEAPRLGPNSTDVLTDGMVFTVEPGIYLVGWGGVRIEDDVIIENGKASVISKTGKNLR
ncbi:MAG: Xaa-Pro peptidase family protein [Dehalococcoidia bacterium]|nr:Xaa-Pro peptidase family protein [Dehalococcoidia bacterium]